MGLQEEKQSFLESECTFLFDTESSISDSHRVDFHLCNEGLNLAMRDARKT